MKVSGKPVIKESGESVIRLVRATLRYNVQIVIRQTV